MSQSSFIAAILLGMFIIYLCDKDRLQVYGQALWAAAPASSSGSSNSIGSVIGGAAGSVAKDGIEAALFG